LHARPVQNLALDFRGGKSFGAHCIHGELFAIHWSQMLRRAGEHAGFQQKLLLGLG
jgi:hypothetical protein